MLVPNAPKKDQSGHGTAMAAIVMAEDYGVAREARAIAMGICDEKGNMKAE